MSTPILYLQDQFLQSVDFDAALSKLKKLKISARYNTEAKRIVLFNEKNTNTNYDFNNQEANGIILELETYKLLYMPPFALRTVFNQEIVNSYIKQNLYTVYYAQDATTIGLYYYGNKWVISTARAYEMNDVVWNTKSYSEIFEDCLAAHGYTFNSFTSTLKKKFCYTFLIRHPDIQVFTGKDEKEVKPSIWFVQSVNLNPNTNYYLQKDITTDTKIPTQTVCTEKLHINEMYDMAEKAITSFQAGGEPLYGFVLRSNNTNKTSLCSDLFIESKLCVAIRQTWYDSQMIRHCKERKYNRSVFVAVSSYFDVYHFPTFQILFPQFKSITDKVHELFNLVIAAMVNKKTYDNIQDEKTLNIVRAALSGFNVVSFDISALQLRQKIREYMTFLRSPKYCHLFIDALIPA